MHSLKNYLLLLLTFSITTANAQFKKGDKMAGTSVASVVYNSGNSDISVANIGDNKSKNTNYSVNLSPSLGWFVSENTAIGFSLNINPASKKVTYEQNGSTYQSDKASNFNIGIGGFARNYFSKGGSLLPFGQASINAGISSYKEEGFFYGGTGSSAYKQTYDGSSSGGFFANATFTGGFTKMMGENAGLDFYLGYNFSYNKNVFKRTALRDDGNNGSIDTRGENETTTKFTNHGFLLGVGFQVFLRGKK